MSLISGLCVLRQAAAVGVFLRFFGLGILALGISERHVQQLVADADSDRPHAGPLHLTSG